MSQREGASGGAATARAAEGTPARQDARLARLQGARASFELPFAQAGGGVAATAPASHRAEWGSELVAALERLGDRHGVEPPAVLLSGLLAVLQRYTGLDRLLVAARVGESCGLLVEGDLRGDPDARALLRRSAGALAEATAHADLPVAGQLEVLEPGPGGAGVAAVLFAYRDATAAAAGGGASAGRRDGAGLAVHVTRGDGRLALELSATAGSEAGLRRLCLHLETVLAAMAADPGMRVGSLPLLHEQERRDLLAGWNRGRQAAPARSRCVHELFEARAAEHPHAPAVRFDGDELTYGALEARANQLAHHLRGLGVGLEQPVGLCVERSLEMVIGVLGILKAGAAYVSLDPRDPQARLRTVAQDAGIRVVLTLERLGGHLDGLGALVCLDRDWPVIEQCPATSPAAGARPGNAAYIAYTSGSTGTPKGACIPHAAVTRLVVEPDFISIAPDDVFLQLAPLAFDASTLEIWGPLLAGACLTVFPAQEPSLERLARVLRTEGVTTLWLTAGLFHQMAEAAPEAFAGLRQLLAGGDVLSVAHVNRTLEAAPGLRLVNGYGPTENTTFTCCHTVTGQVTTPSVPIGRPVPATRVWVLDAELRPVPVGVPGELYASGDGLARGYAGRPGLTAGVFVPNPFGEPGERMYRTGDLVRWCEDGTIAFLGRRDHQMKVRGFRIEPGEVETAIMQHPSVKDVVAVAREDASGSKRLVAYVLPERQSAGLLLGLRRRLAAVLPAHAVPSSFVLVDELPLTANGKVDRAALPSPQWQEPDVSAGYVAPRSELEESLAALWSELLEVTRVGVDDDFFELGGHSLVATRITTEILEAYGVDVDPRTFYERPTVADLAAVVQRGSPAPVPAGAGGAS